MFLPVCFINSIGMVMVSYNHPLRLSPTTFYQRPFYNGQTGEWTGLTNVATALTASGTAMYDAGGSPKGINGTTGFLTNSTTTATWLGSGTHHIYARVKTNSITSTSAIYSAHAIFTDSLQYILIGLRHSGGTYGTSGATFECGFMDHDGAANLATVDITAYVDNNGAGEFSIQAKKDISGNLWIRVNDDDWVAGTTGVGATANTTGVLEVGGGTYSLELDGETLAFGTWAGSTLTDADSNWLATWEPPKTAWTTATPPKVLYLPRRYNDAANTGLGVWTNSIGLASSSNTHWLGAASETNPPAISVSVAGSPDFEDSVPHTALSTTAGWSALEWIGTTSSDFSTWAWVRPESITLDTALSGSAWLNHVIWVDTAGFVGVYLYKNGSNFYAYLYCYDTAARTASVDVTAFVDSNGAGEFTIAARRISGVMSISVNGGSWITGDTCTTIGGGATSFAVGRYGSGSIGYFDGIIFGVGTWPSYAFTDQDKADLEEMAASLFDETEEASALYKKGNYAVTSAAWIAIGSNNTDTNIPLASDALQTATGNAFLSSNTVKLHKIYFSLKKLGSPTGNATVRIYAASLAYNDANSVPTGSPLASATIDVSTLTTLFVSTAIELSPPLQLTAGESYYATIEYSGGAVGSDRIDVQAENTSPVASLNGGTCANFAGSWSVNSGYMLYFYIESFGGGYWTPTVGGPALKATSGNPTASSGAPDFNGGNVSTGTFLESAMTFANIFGSEDHCGYSVIDLDTVHARAAGDDYTNRALWGFGDISGGSAATMLLAIISDSGTPKAEFTTWDGSYSRATSTLSVSTGKVFIAWRRWKGRLWISTDGAIWTQGDVSSVTSIASGSLRIGKGPDQLTEGSIDGRILELQFVKGAGRGEQWLKGAYERAVREHNLP